MQSETFYPPKASVEKALEEFAAYPKRGAIQGDHRARDLQPDIPISAIYGEPITPESLPRKQAQYRKDGMVPDQEWVEYWMNKSDDEIIAMINEGKSHAGVPNSLDGHPVVKGNYNTLVPVWGQYGVFRAEHDGGLWGPGIKVINPATGKEVEITDDGEGWLPPEGFPHRSRFRFKAAYRNYLIRKLVYVPYNGEYDFDGPSYREHASPVYALAYAYAVTREGKYAERALLILNRLAEYYRHYTSKDDAAWEMSKYIYRGYIDDENFECAFIVNLALAYDLVWDAASESLRANIERNLYGYTWEFLKRTEAGAMGNMAIRQLTARAHLALVFRNDLLMDFVVNGGRRGAEDIILGGVHREGRYYEDSSSYAAHVNQLLIELSGVISLYKGAGNFADGVPLNPAAESRIAAIRQWESKEDCSGRTLAYGNQGNPRSRVFALRNVPPVDLNGYDVGLTVMRQGEDEESRRHVLLYHGLSGFGHGHYHQLMLKTIAYGFDFSGDLGYPNNWSARKFPHWTMATVTHPTVVVDGESQVKSGTASLLLRGKHDWLQVASAYSPDAYSQSKLYHRTAVVIEDAPGRTFVVDFFRVNGGKVHDYAFHSIAGDDAERFELSEGVTLKPQPGTLAGKGIVYGTGSSYSFLKDIAIGRSDRSFRATWYPDHGVGFHLHVPAGFLGEIILGKGEGEGPFGRSPMDAYLILRNRNPERGSSAFVALHEAFQNEDLGLQVSTFPLEMGVMPLGVKISTSLGNEYEIRSFLSAEESRGAEMLTEAIEIKGRATVYRLNWPTEARERRASPSPIRGTLIEVDHDRRAVTIESSDSLNQSTFNPYVAFTSLRYSRVAGFDIVKVESKGENRWELQLGNDAVIGSGKCVRLSGGTITSPVVSEKLLNSPSLFNGKVIRNERTGKLFRLKQGRVEMDGMVPVYQHLSLEEPASGRDWAVGDRYTLFDFGVGDGVLINREEVN